MLGQYPSRSFLGFSMMVTQAFLYNAIFFTYALVLQHFYQIPSDRIGVYFFPFAVGNLLGPLLLGHLFDTIGRRKMILATYGGSGILLAISAVMFHAGMLNAVTQTGFWCVIFFFASAGASSAYLTVSEIFPAGVARAGDLVLLRHLAAGRWRGRAPDLRRPDRQRHQQPSAHDRLLHWRRYHDRRWTDRLVLRRQCRTQVAGGYRHAAFGGVASITPTRAGNSQLSRTIDRFLSEPVTPDIRPDARSGGQHRPGVRR